MSDTGSKERIESDQLHEIQRKAQPLIDKFKELDHQYNIIYRVAPDTVQEPLARDDDRLTREKSKLKDLNKRSSDQAKALDLINEISSIFTTLGEHNVSLSTLDLKTTTNLRTLRQAKTSMEAMKKHKQSVDTQISDSQKVQDDKQIVAYNLLLDAIKQFKSSIEAVLSHQDKYSEEKAKLLKLQQDTESETSQVNETIADKASKKEQEAASKKYIDDKRVANLKANQDIILTALYGRGINDQEFFIKTVKATDLIGPELRDLIPAVSDIPHRIELEKALKTLKVLLEKAQGNATTVLLQTGIVANWIGTKMLASTLGMFNKHKYLPRQKDLIKRCRYITDTVFGMYIKQANGGSKRRIKVGLPLVEHQDGGAVDPMQQYYQEFQNRRGLYNTNSTDGIIPTLDEIKGGTSPPPSSPNPPSPLPPSPSLPPTTTSTKLINTKSKKQKDALPPIPLNLDMPKDFIDLYSKGKDVSSKYKNDTIDQIYFLYHGNKEAFNKQYASRETPLKLDDNDTIGYLLDDNNSEPNIYFWRDPTGKEAIVGKIAETIQAQLSALGSSLTAEELYKAIVTEKAETPQGTVKTVTTIIEQTDTIVENGQVISASMPAVQTTTASMPAIATGVPVTAATVQYGVPQQTVSSTISDPRLSTSTCQPCNAAAMAANFSASGTAFLKYEMEADVLNVTLKMIQEHRKKVEMMQKSTLIPEMQTKLGEIKQRILASAPEKDVVSDKHVRAIKRGYGDTLDTIRDSCKRYYNINYEFLMDLRKRIEYMSWWEAEMNRRIALEKAYVAIGEKIKTQAGGSLDARYKPLLDQIQRVRTELNNTGLFCVQFFSQQMRGVVANGLKEVTAQLTKLPEEEDKNTFNKKRDELLNYIDKLENKIFSMYNIKYSLMDIILDKRFLGLYLFKLITFGILVGSMFFAEKIFSEIYMKKVYAENQDAPSIMQMYGIFVGLLLGFHLFLVTIMLLLMYIFKTPANDFLISGDFIKRFLIDFALYLVILSLVLIVVGTVLAKKRYFRYKTEGLRCIRAYRELAIGIGAILVVIPYFSFV